MIKLILVFSVFYVSSIEQVKSLELPELLTSIAKIPTRSVGFTETRTAEFLEKPLLSIGYLEFHAPASLIKKISYPEKIIQSIKGNTLTIYQNDKIQQTISLSEYPQLAIGVNAIRWVLSGNINAINQNFKVTFRDNKKQWWLILAPSDPEILEHIASILLVGKSTNIIRIELKQSNGDSIITELYEQH